MIKTSFNLNCRVTGRKVDLDMCQYEDGKYMGGGTGAFFPYPKGYFTMKATNLLTVGNIGTNAIWGTGSAQVPHTYVFNDDFSKVLYTWRSAGGDNTETIRGYPYHRRPSSNAVDIMLPASFAGSNFKRISIPSGYHVPVAQKNATGSDVIIAITLGPSDTGSIVYHHNTSFEEAKLFRGGVGGTVPLGDNKIFCMRGVSYVDDSPRFCVTDYNGNVYSSYRMSGTIHLSGARIADFAYGMILVVWGHLISIHDASSGDVIKTYITPMGHPSRAGFIDNTKVVTIEGSSYMKIYDLQSDPSDYSWTTDSFSPSVSNASISNTSSFLAPGVDEGFYKSCDIKW